MMRLLIAALLGLVMLTACQAPRPPAPEVQANSQADLKRRAIIRLQLATNYMQAGQNTVALQEAQQAIAIDPELADAYHVRALVYANMNESVLAEQSFRSALSLRGDDGDLLNNFGWFLCQQARYQEALPMLERAVAAPSASGPLKPQISLGVCRLRRGDLDGAEKSLQRALGYDRSNAAAITNLALVYFRRGEFPRAWQTVGRVNGGNAASAQSLWLGARIAHRQGDAAAQEAMIAQLRSRFPESSELAAYEQGAWDE